MRKGNGEWYYCASNEKSMSDAYVLPSILEILDQLRSAKYFSVFDLESGFYQIEMKTAAEKRAFSTPYGHYEFTRIAFGLKNAPTTFQRLMGSVFTNLQGIRNHLRNIKRNFKC